MDTLQSVKAELERRRGEWPALCEATGISYHWLTKLARGVIRDPGISKIDRLQQYFGQNPRPTERVEAA